MIRYNENKSFEANIRRTLSPETDFTVEEWNNLNSLFDGLLERLNYSDNLMKIAYRRGMDNQEYRRLVSQMGRLYQMFREDFSERVLGKEK